MNIFEYRDDLLADYSEYVRSFIRLRNPRIQAFVQDALDKEILWPDPLIQLNPTFKPGASINELCEEHLLHPDCRAIFRRNKTPDSTGGGDPLRLHQHQEDAIRVAARSRNYVLTTGTGSGKSLAYIVPIVDRILHDGPGKGIRAIIVYPMNALANSQFGELEKFLRHGFPDNKGPVTFQRYTGQEDDETRQKILISPPDILLTNYVMLELILTRPYERKLVNAARDLQFLVLDELHTYRGRQGADVALLLRRVRSVLKSKTLQCVGTSATLSSRGTWSDQQVEVARLATRLFGVPVEPADIIGETLERATDDFDEANHEHVEALRGAIQKAASQPISDFAALSHDPLSRWVESTFGVRTEPGTGRLIRSRPLPLTGPTGAAVRLGKQTGIDEETCRGAVATTLLIGATTIQHPRTGFPVFPFRLHQFVSRGDTLYATAEDPDSRYLTLRGQLYSPEDRTKILLPLCFCRECGQEYYSVYRARDEKTGVERFTPREAHDRAELPGHELGFLHICSDKPWPRERGSAEEISRLPPDWIEEVDGTRRIIKSRRDRVPIPLCVEADGRVGATGIDAAYIPAPFLFCLNCGITHNARQRSDFPKLGTLGSEGRSTATTVLTTSAISGLHREASIPPDARKLLSFTDNRQDASLQAGHLNDFVEVGLLRGAIHKAAVQAASEGLRDASIAQKVTEALGLPFEAFAKDPTIRFGRDAVNQAFRKVVGYRVYRDLRRGWRVNAPNLEQCGLLVLDYAELDTLVKAEDIWQALSPDLAGITPEQRRIICCTLLDFIRRELCIEVDYLDPLTQETIRRESGNQLCDPWALDERERMNARSLAFPCARGDSENAPMDSVFLSARSGFGLFLRLPNTFAGRTPPDVATTQRIICALFDALRQAGVVLERAPKDQFAPCPGYRINPGALIWRAGDGTKAYHDRIRMPNAPAEGFTPNAFFRELYRSRIEGLRHIHAAEHTAQVPSILRQQREDRFRSAKLPILFCSPTMELGIDIRDLNVVNMRNVPPTPANYAQRSGRAGRSGQPAMVFTYCSFGSPHDQYFFRHPDLMVAGQVHTPRIDVTNEDLIRSHIHAIWLQDSGLALGNTPADLLEIEGDSPTLALRPEVRDHLRQQSTMTKARDRAATLLAAMEDYLAVAPWYAEGWLDEVIRGIPQSFENALARWRYLYRTARAQFDDANRIIADPSRVAEHDMARRLRQEAEAQLRLLTDRQSALQSDFYSYRYFASEGFLPGYNFPRLPLSAFIPGRRTTQDSQEFISRPRFLAISEFGPGAFIYHEGARYQVSRVMMPVREDTQGELPTSRLIVCGNCGYLHPVVKEPAPSNCERCNQVFDAADIWTNMFQLQNVVTRRRERINCDEEERLRLGYDLKTGVRFAERDGRPLFRGARILVDGAPIADLQYGDAADVWRINLGWSRERNKTERGFWLDIERRQWTRQALDPDDEDDSGNDKPVGRIQRVIPYVKDRRNSLIVTFAGDLGVPVMASLEAALKRAIQSEYQLEDTELATEPMPGRDQRRRLLIYEASEGGAGVLRQLVDDADSWSRVARAALALCHFDPQTGADQGKAEHAQETCQAACYDCMLSYYNQPEHPNLDRHAIKDFLMRLQKAKVEPSPVETPRAAHMENLKKLCDSGLEKEFLDFLEAHNLRLPTHGQKLYPEYGTRPDFVYGGDNPVFVYVDGPPHDYPHRQQRDTQLTTQLEQQGITVVRFHHQADWESIVRQHPSTFGEIK